MRTKLNVEILIRRNLFKSTASSPWDKHFRSSEIENSGTKLQRESKNRLRWWQYVLMLVY